MIYPLPGLGGTTSSVSGLFKVFDGYGLTKLDIYTCATVIHVARLFHPFELGRSDDDALRRSWQKCIQCLAKYSPFGVAARRARKALILLEKQLTVNKQDSNYRGMFELPRKLETA